MPITAPTEIDTRKAIPIFGLGQQQRSPFISTVKRVNAVVELTDNGRQQAAILGLPGLQTFIDTGDIPGRGLITVNGVFYTVTADQILAVSLNQSQVVIGTLTTVDGPVYLANNGVQLFVNDGVTPMIYTYATGVMTQIADPDFPAGALGAEYLQQRFFVYTPVGSGAAAGRVYASAQQDGTSWDSLDFFTPESLPDGIRGIKRWFNDLVVFGYGSLEWWSGAPSAIIGALGFRPISGANTEVGLVSQLGYAGANQILMFLGQSNGQTGVYKIEGYSAVKVSPPAIDDELNKRPTHTVAVCTAYMVGGHPIFQLTLPSSIPEQALTVICDTSTELWSYRESYGQPYYRGLYATNNGEAVYITDAFSGKIYQMIESVYDENGDPMSFEVTSIHLLKEGDRLAVSECQIDVETGLGTSVGQGSDPQGMIQIAKDGGHTWGAERWVSLGKIGNYKRRAMRRRIGASRDIAVRFRITDPIPRRVTGAYLRLDAGVS